MVMLCVVPDQVNVEVSSTESPGHTNHARCYSVINIDDNSSMLGSIVNNPITYLTVRGATTSSKLGVQILGLGYYYPSTKKIRQVYPVCCNRLHNHTVHQKAT